MVMFPFWMSQDVLRRLADRVSTRMSVTIAGTGDAAHSFL